MEIIKLGSLYQKENKNRKSLKKTCACCDTKVSFFLSDDEVWEITSHGEKRYSGDVQFVIKLILIVLKTR